MSDEIRFALNHITTPNMPSRDFLDLAARLDCVGVELRNDLADKKLTDNMFFDGETPSSVGDYARSKGVRLLGLSEVYGFNRWSETIREKVALLIRQAKESGAETISLIPSNDGAKETTEMRLADLRAALSEILPMLKAAGLAALVEPLGFTTSSLRSKREAIEAIEAVGGRDVFRLVHDTFHHFLAGEPEFFPEMTGIVHISGIIDTEVKAPDMQDGHRILVTAEDRLENIEQIKALIDLGYQGAFSFEPFASSVHADENVESSLRDSIRYIKDAVSR